MTKEQIELQLETQVLAILHIGLKDFQKAVDDEIEFMVRNGACISQREINRMKSVENFVKYVEKAQGLDL